MVEKTEQTSPFVLGKIKGKYVIFEIMQFLPFCEIQSHDEHLRTLGFFNLLWSSSSKSRNHLIKLYKLYAYWLYFGATG